MIGLRTGELTHIVLLGAHCDDLAIGMGGTLLHICESNPGLQVTAYIATGGDTLRHAEEEAALAALCPGAHLTVRVDQFADGYLPSHFPELKRALHEVAATTGDAELVFCPTREDRHQDHRTLAELTPTVFRDHLLLHYEIIKWEADLPQPQLYVPLSEEIATAKAAAITTPYPSQQAKDWFSARTFLALAAVRGVQARSSYAEAFVIDKALLTL